VLLLENPDEREIPVQFGVVHPVPHDERILGEREPHVVDLSLDLAARRLVDERAHAEGGGIPRLQIPAQVLDRVPGVDDVLHDQHVPPFDRPFEVLHQPHRAGRRPVTVRRDADQVILDGDRHLARQIRHEHERAPQDADNQERPSLSIRGVSARAVVVGDLHGQLPNAPGDRILAVENALHSCPKIDLVHDIHLEHYGAQELPSLFVPQRAGTKGFVPIGDGYWHGAIIAPASVGATPGADAFARSPTT
jgi:hypothetical protein